MARVVGAEAMDATCASNPAPTTTLMEIEGATNIIQARAESLVRVRRDQAAAAMEDVIHIVNCTIQDPGGSCTLRRSSIYQGKKGESSHGQAPSHLPTTYTTCLWFCPTATNSTEGQVEAMVNTEGSTHQQPVVQQSTSIVHRRPSKELKAELGTEEEKKTVVTNMDRARHVVHGEPLAVVVGSDESHPVLAVGLGPDVIAVVEERKEVSHKVQREDARAEEVEEGQTHGEFGGQEATGPGAAGTLSGASVSTRQGQ